MKSILTLMAVLITTALSAETGKAAPNFSLVDSQGKTHNLSDYKGKTIVLEWINFECPFVRKHYDVKNMQSLQKKWGEKGVVWLVINSSNEGKQGHYVGDDLKKRIANEKGNQTAYLLDTNGKVGKQYGAKVTPHMYIINPAGTLVYQGAIDNNPSKDSADIPTSINYIDQGLTELMDAKPLSVSNTKAYGCSVKY
jgi:glutathione peroxidase-family protein